MTNDSPYSNWQGCAPCGQVRLVGQHCVLEPLDTAQHADGLFAAIAGVNNIDLWRYMPSGPFFDQSVFIATLEGAQAKLGWRSMIIRCSTTSAILGMASYMRIRPEHGSAVIGCVAFGDNLKRKRAATEVIYLMARHVFDDLGYRRFEWKCNNANAASKTAAVRFGFMFEGVFRNDMIVKGQNRDTAWYAMTDDDWPALRAMYDGWLAPLNFDKSGQQIHKLSHFGVP